MNIESILEKANLFNELVINSGFKRDMIEYYNAIQQAQNKNVMYMKDLSLKLMHNIDIFKSNALDKELDIILKSSQSFIVDNITQTISRINQDASIDANNYFQKFNQLLTKTNQDIAKNEQEIQEIITIFSRYSAEVIPYGEVGEKAVVSLVFKDLKSTKTLKEFSDILSIWSKILHKYHTILTSDSPEEIKLETIQSGSIDVIFNINVDLALSLTDVFKYGMDLFLGYLLYKEKIKDEIIPTYRGNQALIKSEEERESLMLDNIYIGIKDKIMEQHTNHLESDSNIDLVSLDKKIDNISSIITEHIIRGNEYKILSKIEDKTDDNDEVIESYEEAKIELREATAKSQNNLKKLSTEDTQILLDKYEMKEDID